MIAVEQVRELFVFQRLPGGVCLVAMTSRSSGIAHDAPMTEIAEVEAALCRVSFLLEESEEDRLTLARSAEIQVRERGAVLFEHGETCTSVFLIIRGLARLALPGVGGREVNLAVVRAGEFVGVDAALEGRSCVGTCTALSDCRVARIPNDALRRWVREHPRVQELLLVEFARKLRSAWNMLGAQAFLPLGRRALRALLDMARPGAKRPGQPPVARPGAPLADVPAGGRDAVVQTLDELLDEESALAGPSNVISVPPDDLVLDELSS